MRYQARPSARNALSRPVYTAWSAGFALSVACDGGENEDLRTMQQSHEAPEEILIQEVGLGQGQYETTYPGRQDQLEVPKRAHGANVATQVKPRIGQHVLLTSLAWGGPYPGQIVSIAFTGLCAIKLDKQYRPVTNVKYFEDEPDVVDGRYWQICYPDPQYSESQDTEETNACLEN